MASTLFLMVLTRLSFGKSLRALRDNEDHARARGIAVVRQRTLALVGAVAGIRGMEGAHFLIVALAMIAVLCLAPEGMIALVRRLGLPRRASRSGTGLATRRPREHPAPGSHPAGAGPVPEAAWLPRKDRGR